MMALKDLGYSANTTDDTEIDEAYEWLCKLNEATDPAFVTDEVIDSMICEQKTLAVMYSGDASYITSMNDNMGFYIP